MLGQGLERGKVGISYNSEPVFVFMGFSNYWETNMVQDSWLSYQNMWVVCRKIRIELLHKRRQWVSLSREESVHKGPGVWAAQSGQVLVGSHVDAARVNRGSGGRP